MSSPDGPGAPSHESDADHVVTLDSVTKQYGSVTVLDDVSLAIEDGEFLTILGPSGAGKTTLLHLIAGFERPTEGRLHIEGRSVSSLPPNERDVGLVSQNLALFPHLTVEDNVAFPLRRREGNPDDIDQRVREALELVRLPLDYRGEAVDALSGGQRQRVALARAIVYDPALLLLDEPLSSLDEQLREEMRAELARIHAETDLTIVHVTHNQTEALTVADRIAVLQGGTVEQLGTPTVVYANPATPFVAEFVGDTTMLDGQVTASGREVSAVTVGTGTVELDEQLPVGRSVRLGLRAESVAVGASQVATDNAYSGTVVHAGFEGDRTTYTVEVPLLDVDVQVSRSNDGPESDFQRGDDVVVGWNSEDVLVYPE